MTAPFPLEKTLLDQIENGDYKEALGAAREALSRVRSADERARLLYVEAAALYHLDRPNRAAKRLNESIAATETAEARELQAWFAMDRGKFRAALAAAERAISLARDDAGAHHLKGLALVQLDRVEDAEESFRRAAELDPEEYFVPHRLDRDVFEAAVEEALASLPEPFARQLENVEVAVLNVPGKRHGNDDEDWELLGIYQGSTIHDGGFHLPDRIILYQRNLENVSPDRETLLEEIRDTVLHEVGHHMGMEEDELREIEDGEDGEDS